MTLVTVMTMVLNSLAFLTHPISSTEEEIENTVICVIRVTDHWSYA
jgi:hypothetical protein